MSGEDRPAQVPCPICGKPPGDVFRPFCSKRCADVDLQRWLSGRYAIPTADSGSSEGEEEPGGEAP